ncbi:hypothetical protein RBB84_15125 [Rhodococcus sp. D-6]|uniref:Lipoprotein n=1 Tax=Rhodococcus sp. D-6 TaxID=1387842 RepID=A0AAU7UR86_9NOCA|nr:hypothetical protein [Rhodococcus sp. HS-D2]
MRVRAAFPKLLVALTSSSLLLAGCSTAGSDTENDASDECITDFTGAKSESYVLVKCGAPAPELTGELATAQQIHVPITRLYTGSTTHLPLVIELDELDALTGVSNGSYVSDAAVIGRID